MLRLIIDSTPLWAVFGVTAVLLWLAGEIGFRAGVYRSHRPGFDDESHVSATAGAQIALMGFLLAFTFSQAADHYTVRKRLVLDEIVVIDAAYLRAGLVAANRGEPIKAALREYVRLSTLTAGDERSLADMIVRADDIRDRIWAQVEGLGSDARMGEEEALLVDAINRVFEVHEQRVAARSRARIPDTIWIMLYSLLTLSAFAMGYFSGIKGKRSAVTSSAMTLSLAMVIWLIADLDRPQAGFVKADLSSLKEFSDRLN
jgi:hypothetical protein